MKKALTLALLGALVVSPAMARGMGEQRSDIQSGQQSSQLDQNTTRQVQQQLQQQGYDVGQVDGVWGQKSRQALMNFQRDQNMQATGRPDQQTMAALGVQSDSQQAQTPSDVRRQDQQRSQDQQDQQDQRDSMGR
ncbi:MAG: peptidoglycan-binding protein [Rhodospirillaceae bacterium]|nr:peptidoglycan-binding protein [Rhodospirillales bacterium]